MKKLLVITTFINDAINALVGVLAAIGFAEIINIIISVCIGEYIRIDGGDLATIIKDYTFLGLMGYGMAWIFIICNKMAKDDSKDAIEKTKFVISSTWIVSLIITLIGGVILSDLAGTLMLSVIYTVLFGGVLLLVHLLDKKLINKINKKIKENVEKKD